MKKYILSMMALAAVAMTSCTDRDSEGLTRVTTYAVITLEGDDEIVLDKGATYTEPGVKADLGGEDVTADLVIQSDVDTSQSGVYSVTYTYTNADGFSASASRTVYVFDPSNPIEGFWYTDPSSFRLYNGAQVAYGRSFRTYIIDYNDGSIYTNDILAGWYGQRAGYGARYYMGAFLSIDGEGNLDLIESYIPGWGDGLEGFSDGKYDAATGTITYVAEYVSKMQFNVTLTK